MSGIDSNSEPDKREAEGQQTSVLEVKLPQVEQATKPFENTAPRKDAIREFPYDLIFGGVAGGIVGAASALLVAYFAYFQTDKLSRDATYVTFVQSRIDSCIAFSSHHRLQADRDALAGGVSPLRLFIKEQGITVDMTSNENRFLASAVMARSLVMCMVENEDADGLKRCVEDITVQNTGIHVYDHIRDEGEIHVGKLNPAC